MTTREDMQYLMAYMAMCFPNFHPILDGKPNAIDVYLDLLGDMSLDTLKTAVRACCAEPGRAFAPSAGEIRGAATQMHARAAGLPTAGEAWAAVIGSFERMPGGNMAGGGSGPVLDNPVVREAVRQMGGFASIGMDFFENQMPNRAHFLKLYQALYEREMSGAAQLPQVTDYIEGKRQIDGGIKMLAEKLSHPRLEST